MRWSNPPWNERRYGKISIEQSRKSIISQKMDKNWISTSEKCMNLYPTWNVSYPFKKTFKKTWKKNVKDVPIPLQSVTIHNKKKKACTFFSIPSCILLSYPSPPSSCPWPHWPFLQLGMSGPLAIGAVMRPFEKPAASAPEPEPATLVV